MLTLIVLIIIVAALIISTSKFNVHPFLTLLFAAIFVGILSGLKSTVTVSKIIEGFGNTLGSIGIVIAFGTIIGTFLEKSGGAQSMASAVLKAVGEKNSVFAMNITGYIVSIPVFCDSGFIILSALNKALSKKSGISLAVLAVSLAAGLYATHVFVPPTPGPLAAAAEINADLGIVLIWGLIVSIPVSLAGFFWAKFYCKKFKIDLSDDDEKINIESEIPKKLNSFLPIIIPIVLIALKSIGDYPSKPFGEGLINSAITFIGSPIIALLIGVLFSFLLKKNNTSKENFEWIVEALRNAGVIILITGAGGAFGNVLRATGIGDFVGKTLAVWHAGIFLPFIIAAILKSAQGSSTVAIITTAAIISPLLASMGLTAPIAKALVVLSIGAGAMTVSHVNDSYFWVVSQFSDMDTATALRTFTTATLLQGITGILFIALLSSILI